MAKTRVGGLEGEEADEGMVAEYHKPTDNEDEPEEDQQDKLRGRQRRCLITAFVARTWLMSSVYISGGC